MSRLLKILGASLLALNLGACGGSSSSNGATKADPDETFVKKFKEMKEDGKILTVSANDYCRNHGKMLESYDLRLVSGQRTYDSFAYVNLIKSMPEKTEAIVGYLCSGTSLENGATCYGTALIPKLDRSKVEKEK